MTENTDRRSPHARVPFEALVEIAAPDGAAFEAESVDLSATGMHLRTAFVPAVGTALTFRFEGDGGGHPVYAKGEVVWTEDADGGAEFGVRFAELADGDAEAIRQIVSISEGPSESASEPTFRAADRPFAPVRIHIEGMPSPMRAALERSDAHAALVGSELKMLRLGARVELEDKSSAARRPAFVDGVACEIEPETKVPRLVVKLRYEVDPARIDGRPTEKAAMSNDAHVPAESPSAEPETVAAAPRSSEQQRQAMPVAEEDGGHRMKDTMKSAWVGVSSFATKTFSRLGTTVALLRKKGERAEDDKDGRRMTATVATEKTRRTLRPQGASRDISGENEDGAMEEIDSKKVALRRKIAVGAGVGVALLLGVLAFKKPAHHAPIASAPAPELAPSSAPMTAPAPATSITAEVPAVAAAAPSGAPASLVGESTGVDAKGNPNPFGTTTVKKGTKMVLKLDGPASEIKGMNMPNGFVVTIPNRKSLEAAGPLAAKDPRIGSAKVVNQPGGAELTIAFKDSPPAFQVKAKGDTLEIVLAHDKGLAKKGKGKAGAAPAAPKHPTPKKK